MENKSLVSARKPIKVLDGIRERSVVLVFPDISGQVDDVDGEGFSDGLCSADVVPVVVGDDEAVEAGDTRVFEVGDNVIGGVLVSRVDDRGRLARLDENAVALADVDEGDAYGIGRVPIGALVGILPLAATCMRKYEKG